MAEIKVQKVPKKVESEEDILSRFCCYFPAYKFQEARRLPFRRVLMMMKMYKKHHAEKMLDLLEIAVAPHTKNGSGVRSAAKKFKDMMND